jgi:hypothetical protein
LKNGPENERKAQQMLGFFHSIQMYILPNDVHRMFDYHHSSLIVKKKKEPGKIRALSFLDASLAKR